MDTSYISHRSKGFTLIELIVVIAILATLASIAYPAYMSFMDDAKRTSSAKTCADIVEAVTRFRTDNNGALPYVMDAVKPDKNDQIFLKTADGEDANMLKILTNNEDDEDNRVNSLKEFYLKSTEVEEPVDGLFNWGSTTPGATPTMWCSAKRKKAALIPLPLARSACATSPASCTAWARTALV